MLPQYIYCKAFNAAGPVLDDEDQITGRISTGGTYAALTNNTATPAGNGVYRFELSSAERASDFAYFDFASSTGGVSVLLAPSLQNMNVLSGPNLITVVVEDEDSDPISSAFVRFLSGVTSEVKQTDIVGEASFAVESGTWSVLISKSGYTPSNTTEVVTGNETLAYTLVASAAAIVSPPGLCTVTFSVVDSQGAPLQDIYIQATLRERNSVASDNLIDNQIATATTDVSGEASLSLIQLGQFTAGDGLYEIEVRRLGAKRHIAKLVTSIPNQSTYAFAQLIEDAA